ncbi:hypothetical protein HXW84_11090 [Tetragenococcus halophilus]|nr:hypothetical protein [Tetragenococcus halophilus]MCO8292203.1 hypothetical protein [Tetragenococcus halophilus]
MESLKKKDADKDNEVQQVFDGIAEKFKFQKGTSKGDDPFHAVKNIEWSDDKEEVEVGFDEEMTDTLNKLERENKKNK